MVSTCSHTAYDPWEQTNVPCDNVYATPRFEKAQGTLTGMDTEQARGPALEEVPRLYAIVVSGTNREMDPDLAAAMEEVHQASFSNPDNFYNNPQKHREALEGLGRLLAEWQEENGRSPRRRWTPPGSACTGNDHRPRQRSTHRHRLRRRDMLSRLQTALENGDRIRAPSGVIGQVWRDGGRQTLLSRALNRCEEIPLNGRTARSAGQLCGQTGTSCRVGSRSRENAPLVHRSRTNWLKKRIRPWAPAWARTP